MKRIEDINEDDLRDDDVIPYCKLGYTKQEAREKCSSGGCWKYRCYNSKLHDDWSKKRAEWRDKRYSKV